MHVKLDVGYSTAANSLLGGFAAYLAAEGAAPT